MSFLESDFCKEYFASLRRKLSPEELAYVCFPDAGRAQKKPFLNYEPVQKFITREFRDLVIPLAPEKGARSEKGEAEQEFRDTIEKLDHERKASQQGKLTRFSTLRKSTVRGGKQKTMYEHVGL
jgi:hypothetical protein